MDYRRFDDKLVIRMDRGDEIFSTLTEIARKENILLASVEGYGAIDCFTVGVYKLSEKKYYSTEYRGEYELVSLVGTVTEEGGKPYLHAHIGAAAADGVVIGGHLNSAVISITGEFVMNVINGSVGRKLNDTTGTYLMEFAGE